VSKETDGVLRCPKCFGRDVRPSQHRGVIDNVMKWLRRTPYRCRGCHSRFFVFVSGDIEESLQPDTPEASHNPDLPA